MNMARVTCTRSAGAGWPGSTRRQPHSLHSGFLTSAAEAGASIFTMMETSRHRSLDTLRG
jgi:hypothetical protein